MFGPENRLQSWAFFWVVPPVTGSLPSAIGAALLGLSRRPNRQPLLSIACSYRSCPAPPTGRNDLSRISVGTCVMKYAVRRTHAHS